MDDPTMVLHELRSEPEPRLVVLGEHGATARVALVSSSFDPLTLGHVALAEGASALADLTLLVYSPRTMPKEGSVEPSLLPEAERLAAAAGFCEHRPWAALALCSHGLLVDQVEAARRAFPKAEVDLVVGSDKALQLLDPRWYRDRDEALAQLSTSARVRYAVRAGDEGRVEAELARPENRSYRRAFTRFEVDPETAAISAREVRRRARLGEPFDHLVPTEARSSILRALDT